MRKQELLDRILELSARGDSSPAGAEAAQPEVPVPEGEENVPEKKRRGRRPKGYVRVESVENPSADEAVPEQEAPKTPEEAPVSEVRADAHPEQVVRQRTVPAFTASPEKGKPGRPKKRDRLAFAKSAKAIRPMSSDGTAVEPGDSGAVPEDRAELLRQIERQDRHQQVKTEKKQEISGQDIAITRCDQTFFRHSDRNFDKGKDVF